VTYPEQTPARLIEIALGEVGYVEEPVNVTKYGKHTMADGLPWCGSFVMWCCAKANIKIPNVISTAAGAQKFKDQNRWSEVPQKGWLAFMDFPHDGIDRISHIGIVVDVKENSIVCVEGNTSGTGDQRNGGMVMIKERQTGKGSPVVGYGIPRFTPYSGDFPQVAIPDSAKAPQKPKKAKKKNDKSQGSSGELVA
jgi:surface antigen